MIEQYTIKSNGLWGIIKEPYEKSQHPNQQNGLDLYIRVLNFSTGEICVKKLYENTKGLHFKHSGNGWHKQKQAGTHYLNGFTQTCTYVPFQIVKKGDE